MQNPFSEKFLQIIWNEQLFANRLHCTNQMPLQIISPGIWNTSAGPDFKNAAILIGQRLFHGDIEIHLRSSDWQLHGHHGNPAYDNVILHAVWQDNTPEIAQIEHFHTFEMCNQLNQDWQSLITQIDASAYPYALQVRAGACALRWALTDNEQIGGILDNASLIRIRQKAERLALLCQKHGDDQALYLQIMDAMGYHHLRNQFRLLGENCTIQELRQTGTSLERMALFFGCAGMLPDPTRCPVLPQFASLVDTMWQLCWEKGTKAVIHTWPNFFGRPLNNPCRRLMAALLLLDWMNYQPSVKLQQIIDDDASTRQFIKDFLHLRLEDEKWQKCLDFSHRLKQPTSLLGKSRKTELLINIFLPYMMTKANQDNKKMLIFEQAKTLPKCQDNRIIKEAIHRLLSPPSRYHDLIKGAVRQQGLMHIYRTFCLALNHDCRQCPFFNLNPTET